jgi:hypothetical protein
MTVRLKVLAGTQLVENAWHVLKHHIMPPEAPANAALIEEYCLAFMHRSQAANDPFMDLGRAVASYLQRWGGNPFTKDPAYQKPAPDAEAEAPEVLSMDAPMDGEVPQPSFAATRGLGAAA